MRPRKCAKGKQLNAPSTANDERRLIVLLDRMGIAAPESSNAELEGKLAAAFLGFLPWILSAPSGKQNERKCYPALPLVDSALLHLLLPYKRTDTKYKGSDDGTRADIGLVSRPIDADVSMVDGSAYGVFAITEVKASSGPLRAASTADSSTETADLDADSKQAFKQLFVYSHQVFAEHPDRRFMRGFTEYDNQ
ncbi:hypothetical protein EV183_005317 [Coemansia sp. RSA 2336]|nr:hypothetical protein EV183_005317 [Coemansia sp. RSA 2336]